MANFKLIRQIAKGKGITIRDLAAKTGILDSTIHHIISVGSTNTTTIENIAKVLEVPVGIFFDNEYSLTPSQEKLRIEELERENKHLRELLEEKERTIRILMKDGHEK